MGKSILITGCSSGIGLDCATTLHARGWHVFASCRDAADCARLAKMGLDSPRLDHTDDASIRATFDYIQHKTGGQLSAVFINGAYAIPGLLEDMPTQALRTIFETNFFGYHTITRHALPIMRKQGTRAYIALLISFGFCRNALAWGLQQ